MGLRVLVGAADIYDIYRLEQRGTDMGNGASGHRTFIHYGSHIITLLVMAQPALLAWIMWHYRDGSNISVVPEDKSFAFRWDS